MKRSFTKTTLITSCILAALTANAHANETAANHSDTEIGDAQVFAMQYFYW
ncbi:hypothetical protein [Vibrio scophthalmi]|nr:hypothetical protein [Vibrio scophthalmi]